MAEAGHQVVVDHAGRLHVGVADGGADEAEPPADQLSAHGIGLPARGRQVLGAPAAGDDRRAVHEVPHEPLKTAELLADLQESPSVGDRAFHLQAVANDAGILQEVSLGTL